MNKDILNIEPVSAHEAYAEVQRIAFAPIVFQAVRALRDLGILSELEAAGAAGSTAQAIADELDMSNYGVGVLLESGASAGVVNLSSNGHFVISKVGQLLLHDRMAKINMDFTHFVCYRGMYFLDKAVNDGQPIGLRSIDDRHSTIYEALPHLPEDVRSSWYAFDHFYSDAAYSVALDSIFSRDPETLVDIGANRGQFSILAARSNDSLRVTMIDLKDQLKEAAAAVEAAGFGDRVVGIAMDVRGDISSIPSKQDVYWLSQFVCCLSESEIVSLLQRIKKKMAGESRLYVLETCWDRQQHQAASYALVNTSLYFTCIANGNSKMYSADELLTCLERSGLLCERITDVPGSYHTLFECRRRPA